MAEEYVERGQRQLRRGCTPATRRGWGPGYQGQRDGSRTDLYLSWMGRVPVWC